MTERATKLCDDMRMNAPRIVALWEEAVEREPWILPRQLARADFVPDMVEAIATATVCLPPTRTTLLALAKAASEHASGRAAAGADHARVVLEYYFLRNAIWAYFGERQHEIEQEEEMRAILHVDVAVSLATRAALLGYYQHEFAQRGEWPAALDRLVDELPPLWDIKAPRPQAS